MITIGPEGISNIIVHRGLKPGQEVLEKVGGAHKLQGWNHNILTG